jgi:hypothetical protein
VDPDMAISANSVQMLARIGAEHGLEPSHLLMRAGVAGEVLTDPRAEVTIRQEYAVMRALLAGCGHPPGFGVEVGMRYHLAMHGIWGLLMATSRDLREAIGIGGRYLSLAWAFTPHHAGGRTGREQHRDARGGRQALGRHSEQGLLGHLRHAEVTGAAGPQPVRVVVALDAEHDGVAQHAERGALGVGESP